MSEDIACAANVIKPRRLVTSAKRRRILTIESLIRTKRIALLFGAITVTWIQPKYKNKERQVNLEIYGNQALPSTIVHTLQ